MIVKVEFTVLSTVRLISLQYPRYAEMRFQSSPIFQWEMNLHQMEAVT